MFFYIHFILLTSGLSGVCVLLGVFIQAYSDASTIEVGFLLMSIPFMLCICNMTFCSMADRQQAHRTYLCCALIAMFLGFMPHLIIPFFPAFYQGMPRVSWYVLALSSYLGRCGLGLAWAIGETLAVNYGVKTGTPYGRMRLTGTVSWGIYGFIVGQINETPYLPKYVPAVLILSVSILVEILLVIFWKAEDFVMVDAATLQEKAYMGDELKLSSSLCGSVASDLNAFPRLARDTMRTPTIPENSVLQADDGDCFNEVPSLSPHASSLPSQHDNTGVSIMMRTIPETIKASTETLPQHQSQLTLHQHSIQQNQQEQAAKKEENPQLIIFKMIFKTDGRAIKYFLIFILAGILFGPLNFVFLSLEEVCREKSCNFSSLSGFTLVSQAASESLFFLIIPNMMKYLSRKIIVSMAFIVMTVRYFFYAFIFYLPSTSPYWTVLAETAYGMSYAIIVTVAAETALMFANECKLFIPELRNMGFLTDKSICSKEQIEAEENAIKMALRATMQAMANGFYEGLGNGLGNLGCGFLVEAFGYTGMWLIFTILSLSMWIIHGIVEISRCRFSDNFKPKPGTKAFEVLTLGAANPANSGRLEAIRRRRLVGRRGSDYRNSESCDDHLHPALTGLAAVPLATTPAAAASHLDC